MPAKNYSLGDLYDVLREKLPQFVEKGRLDVRELAKAANTSDKALYKAFKEERLTAAAAKRLVSASSGALEPADLLRFVIV